MWESRHSPQWWLHCPVTARSGTSFDAEEMGVTKAWNFVYWLFTLCSRRCRKVGSRRLVKKIFFFNIVPVTFSRCFS
jgi:hypothetical protein